jgi:hypothetical protein
MTAAAASVSFRRSCGRYYNNVNVSSRLSSSASKRPFPAAHRRHVSTNNKSSQRNAAMTATILSHHDYDVILDGPIVEASSPMAEPEFPSQAMILKQRDDNLTPQELQLKKALLHHHHHHHSRLDAALEQSTPPGIARASSQLF